MVATIGDHVGDHIGDLDRSPVLGTRYNDQPYCLLGTRTDSHH